MRIDAGRVPAEDIIALASETRGFLPVQTDNVGLAGHFDLVLMPLSCKQPLIVLILLLAWRGPEFFNLIDRTSMAEERAIQFAGKTGILSRFFIDLNFKAGVDRDKGGVARSIDRIWRRIGQPRITEPNEHAGVVVIRPEWMSEQEIEAQDEILELLRLVKQEANPFGVLLCDQHPFE